LVAIVTFTLVTTATLVTMVILPTVVALITMFAELTHADRQACPALYVLFSCTSVKKRIKRYRQQTGRDTYAVRR
jgi:hypothetical protein